MSRFVALDGARQIFRQTGVIQTAHLMKKIEFKTVSYEPGFKKRLSGDEFGPEFLQLLSEHGEQGWDLKEVIRDSGMHTLVIFSREIVATRAGS